MSLPHAILGILQEQPMTGYDLKTIYFDDTIAHFWPADQAQIYRTLDKMAEQGLVESQLEVQEDRPNRKVYFVTEAGRAELARWLTTEQTMPSHREAFLIQLFLAGQLSDAQIIELLEGQKRQHEALLAHYQQIVFPEAKDPAEQREHMLQHMTLDLGLRNERAYIDWLETCIATVKSFSH